MIVRHGLRLGYVHLYHVLVKDCVDLLLEFLGSDELADAHGLVLDLRGRGGSAAEAQRLVEVLDAQRGSWRRPLVVLVDAGTRSAKEVVAYELQRRSSALVVGERTPGAVIPASFVPVAQDGVLMYPAFTLGRYTTVLEGRGVEPDVPVADTLAFAAGADPILEGGVIALRLWCQERASGL